MNTLGKTIIIGATQGTGQLIAQRLIAKGQRVRIAARDTAKAQRIFGASAEVFAADITRPATLDAALAGAENIVLTAGVTKRPAGEALVRATEYEGMRNVIAAAQRAGLPGRLLYMTSIGVGQRSFAGWVLNLVKGNTLRWRAEAEHALRDSDLPYTIIRCGVLTNAPAGRRLLDVGQHNLPLSFATQVGRADVADVFVQALRLPQLRNVTFELVYASSVPSQPWQERLASLKPDTHEAGVRGRAT